MSQPTVDVVTVNYNSTAHLPEYFAALERLDYPRDRWRLVMVDNASTDHSVDRLPQWGVNVPMELIALTKNGGATAGNNVGIRAGNSEYVALLNPDTQILPDWLTLLVGRMELEPQVGLAESRQIPAELNKYYDPVTGDTSWASTGGALIRRSALNHVGLFEERFFMYEDDVDLCWRLWLNGWRCVYASTAAFFHRPHDQREASPFMRYITTRNRAYMYAIYGSAVLYGKHLIRTVRAVFYDRPHLRRANARAFWDGIRALPWLLVRRAALPTTKSPWVGLFEAPYRPNIEVP